MFCRCFGKPVCICPGSHRHFKKGEQEGNIQLVVANLIPLLKSIDPNCATGQALIAGIRLRAMMLNELFKAEQFRSLPEGLRRHKCEKFVKTIGYV